MAKDVCAFANRRGGVLVLGVAEHNGTASKALPLEDVGDSDARHVRSVLGSWCAPVPDIDVIPVSAEPGQTEGFIIIVVPPSARAPHAVAPPQTNTFSWPVRRGTQTIWLSESELADAYRTRASRVADEAARLDQLVAGVVGRLATPDPWLVSVLVPAGARPPTPIDRQVVDDYTAWFRDIETSVPNAYRALTHNTGIAGPRRVLFTDIDIPGKPFAGAAAELHTDGASLEAQHLYPSAKPDVRSFNDLPDDTRILWGSSPIEAGSPAATVVTRGVASGSTRRRDARTWSISSPRLGDGAGRQDGPLADVSLASDSGVVSSAVARPGVRSAQADFPKLADASTPGAASSTSHRVTLAEASDPAASPPRSDP